MTNRPALPCKHCNSPVLIRPTVTGRLRPFDHVLQSAEDVDESARWVPRPGPAGTVMVRADTVSPARLARIRWYATAHFCTPYLRAARARHDPAQVGDLTEQLLTHFGMAPGDNDD